MTTSEPPRTWTLPTLNHLAGPSDLADVVCDFLKFQGEFFESVAVRLDRLRALLNIIYHASLSPEEGRLQRFRVFVTPKESNRANLVANFELDLPEDEAGVREALNNERCERPAQYDKSQCCVPAPLQAIAEAFRAPLS